MVDEVANLRRMLSVARREGRSRDKLVKKTNELVNLQQKQDTELDRMLKRQERLHKCDLLHTPCLVVVRTH
jgi:hypothetical protein